MIKVYKFGTSVNGGVSCWCVFVCFSLQNLFIAIYSALVTNLAFIIFFDYDFLFFNLLGWAQCPVYVYVRCFARVLRLVNYRLDCKFQFQHIATHLNTDRGC